MKFVLILSSLLFFVSCNTQQTKIDEKKREEDIFVAGTDNFNLKYAKGFTIEEKDGYKIITLNEAWKDVGETHRYVLYKDKKPAVVLGAEFIKVPIKTIACMSLTHVAFLEKLGLENTIIGVSGSKCVSSKNVRERIDNKFIKELGQEQNVNYELLTESSPDIVMAFGINTSSNAALNKMKELGLNVVLNSEYMENHPLGKAEWIKFVAAFYNKSELADSIFNNIEIEYNELANLVKSIKNKPTVFTGMPWSGSWYVPGGESFQAKLFKDAGAEYLWSDNEEISSLIKAKEVIIDEAYDADFWLNLNSYTTIASVVNFDEKFKGISAIKKEQLYNNDALLNGAGGNAYWESGVVNPHIVLKDLIEVFHPDILDHELYYYRKME